MALVMVGVNPRRAPFLPLSRAFADEAARRSLLEALVAHRSVGEALLWMAEGRAEVYAVVETGVDGYGVVADILADQAPVAADAAAHGYFAEGLDAATHLFASLAGVDEFAAPGEQSPGSLAAAVAEARRAASLGAQLEALAAAALRLEQRLAASACQESAAALGETVAELARRVFDHLDRRQVLVVGADPSSLAAAEALGRAGVSTFVVVGGGTTDGAAAQLGATVVGPEALSVVLGCSDVVLACAGAGLPLLDKRLVKGALRARRGRPMLLVDGSAGAETAIEPRVAALDGAFLYTVADLASITRETPWARLGSAPSRNAAIAEAARAFSYQLS